MGNNLLPTTWGGRLLGDGASATQAKIFSYSSAESSRSNQSLRWESVIICCRLLGEGDPFEWGEGVRTSGSDIQLFKKRSCIISVEQRLPLTLQQVSFPSTANSTQFNLLCCQPEPVPGFLAVRAHLFTLMLPYRLSAWYWADQCCRRSGAYSGP